MGRIGTYPKFAKYTLLSMFTLAACAVFFMVVSSILDFPKSGAHQVAALVLVVLALPILSAFEYLLDPVGCEAKRVGFVDDGVLQQQIVPLLKHVNYPVRVGYYSSCDVNAFCISDIFGHGSLIAFSTGLTSIATGSQLLAIAAHEIAHLKNGDSINKSYILSFNRALQLYPQLLSEMGKIALTVIARMTFFVVLAIGILMAFIEGIAEALDTAGQLLWMSIKMGFWPAVAIVGFIAFNHILNRAFFAYSRATEFVADADGAAMTSPSDMNSALGLLTNPGNTISVFDTHPPLDERQKRLCGGVVL